MQSLVPARRLPRSAFSSLPRPQGALPLGFSATSADPPPASRRGGAGEAPGLPKRSEGNHLGYRPWSAAGVPRERIAGRAGHFPAGTPPRLSWAASPGCRMLGPPLLPSARRLGPPTDRLLPPPLELLGRQSVCKTWPWPSPVRPHFANKKREGSSERPRANLAPPALQAPGPARAFGSPAGTGARTPLCQGATLTWDSSSGEARRHREPLSLPGCAPHGGLLALAQGGTGRATP